MNAKLAYSIGQRLGMAKVAVPKPPAGVVTMTPEIAAKQRAAQTQIAGQQRQTPKKPQAPQAAAPGAGGAGVSADGNVISLGMDPAARKRVQGGAGAADGADNFKELKDGGGVRSIDVGGAGGAGVSADGNVISLGMDPAVRKRIQDGASPMSKGEQQFYGDFGPDQMKNYMQRYFSQMTGFGSPAEYTGWDQAQNAGVGRALRARANRRWVQGMFQR